MLKLFVFWLLLQPLYSDAHLPIIGILDCDCPAATGLRKTGETDDSFSIAWVGNSEATGYEVWYVREGDSFTSSVVTVTTTAHTFNNLLAGQHTFYVRVVCDSGTSSFIGIQDIIDF